MDETRVAATPETVKKFSANGSHVVLIQSGAGTGASITDENFREAGATIVNDAAELYKQVSDSTKSTGSRFI